jgi:hypothetical protein
MSEESERDHVTGAMASFTPVRGSKMGKWFCVFMDPVKKEFEHAVCDDHVRTIIEHIYHRHPGWEVVTQNLMPGKLCTTLHRGDDGDVYYINAPIHGQAVPNSYELIKRGGEPGWYFQHGDDTLGPFSSAEHAAEKAWEDLEG